ANIHYGYDAVGNLTKKSDYSENSNNAYSYTTGTNKISSIRLKDDTGTVSFGYDNKGNQTHRNGTQEVTYDVFNKPLTIHKNGSNITLAYGADLARYKQIRVVQEDGQEKTITTHYIGKHYEVEIDESGNRERKTYLGDVAIITDSDNEGMHISYTHRDRLGSAATFTNAQNSVTARRHFDAFGKPRNGDWSQLESLSLAAQLGTNLLDTSMTTRRGFTDHEHLDEAELIHMNGRVYDYNVGRFMSVDPVIQSPANSQSINPYSYIMNNPMSGTDPTGYESCPQGQECASVSPQGTETLEVNSDTQVYTDSDGNHYVDAGDGSGDLIKVDSVSGKVGGVQVTKNFGDNGIVTSISATNSSGTLSVTDIGSENQKPSFIAADTSNQNSGSSIDNPDSLTVSTNGFLGAPATDSETYPKELMNWMKNVQKIADGASTVDGVVSILGGIEKMRQAVESSKNYDRIADLIPSMNAEQIGILLPEFDNNRTPISILRKLAQVRYHEKFSNRVRARMGAALLSGGTDIASGIYGFSNPYFGYITLASTIAGLDD
ncbi:RHS repeat domain-containing protein, partial [Alteromonas sp. a30]|uniref:RHS repeat domain-containing protein n=1 Tax=Alteromonas sp. a30 TaxID=2730917 RepID=UPI002DDD8168